MELMQKQILHSIMNSNVKSMDRNGIYQGEGKDKRRTSMQMDAKELPNIQQTRLLTANITKQ